MASDSKQADTPGLVPSIPRRLTRKGVISSTEPSGMPRTLGPVYIFQFITLHRLDRIRATVPSVAGVCFGFFTYHQNADGSNVQETDIEFLSSDANYYNTIHYTNQPGTVNGNVDPNAYHVSRLACGICFCRLT